MKSWMGRPPSVGKLLAREGAQNALTAMCSLVSALQEVLNNAPLDFTAVLSAAVTRSKSDSVHRCRLGLFRTRLHLGV